MIDWALSAVIGFASGVAVTVAYRLGLNRSRRRALDAMEEAFSHVRRGPLAIACIALRIRWQILLEGGTLEDEADDHDLGGDGGGASSLGAVGPPTVAAYSSSSRKEPT